MTATATRRAALWAKCLLSLLALTLMTAACSGAPDDGQSAAQRIVSISPTATEMLFAIGAGDRVVAVDQFSYYPADAPVTDIDGWNPNIEAIASYGPDLVVLQTSGDVAASLEALGIEVWSHDAPFVFEDVYAQIEQLGAVTAQDEEAAARWPACGPRSTS